MRSTAEYLALLRQYKKAKAIAYGIKMLGIFGSVARNEQTEDSDIDIVYEGEANILLRSRIRTELENLLGCKVDLIRFRKQTENTPFGQAILKDLILV